ncbi:MAG: hypothetical protein CMJ45_06560 [Planctomyces sp.]|nr:hypothetical protein [Planctomyces sp.]MDP7275918.1 PSD1 and planctomycete cytochrome C domain-containing protein [Planctomycetaceae bacterium]
MLRIRLTTPTLLLIVGATLQTVLAAPPTAKTTDKPARVDFSREIRPLLAEKCLICHGPSKQQRASQLRLDQAEKTIGSVVVPGQPTKSELLKRISSDDPKTRMPPADSHPPLSPAEIDTFRRWIAQGADYSLHWSFVPPVRPGLPRVADAAWPRNSVDHFVLNRLEATGLKPSPEADRITLIRRLTLDLTGLPPTTEEIDRFVEDNDRGAWERVVDRLFSSQHYGERMAMSWLDLSRYGDTNGYENDSERRMWPYRDWVINAFNTNMPFDRFTLEQIAGDLLPHASTSQRIASGFNRNTTYNEEGGADPDEFLVVYAVERASTTGTVFLGLTLGCAQCHEHKYDPISQTDFYRFYAFFNSVDGEKGAMGHDIPLPPLLDLATPRQQQQRDRLAEKLETIGKQIKARVAGVKLDAAKDTATKKEGKTDDGFFTKQSDWEAYAAKLDAKKLPKQIVTLLKSKPEDRNDDQKKQLREYFIERGYSVTRTVFAPLHKQQDALQAEKDKLEKAIPTTMIMKAMAKRRPAHLLIRGDFLQKGSEVQPGIPSIFKPLSADRPRNRLGLARWLTDPDNPLVGRVAVNRLWTQFFGSGLVLTPEDFGVRGKFPTHPRLLDWLTVEFIRTGWNVKALQKRIVMSSTYRQSSHARPDALAKDPLNRLLARQNRFRLSAEEVRDVALSISGLLNNRIGGPSVYPFQPQDYYSDKGRWKWPESTGGDLYRRGLYTFWRRTTTFPTFQIFDAPSRETCIVKRPRTNTPLQALVTLNERTFVESARAYGERIVKRGGPSLDSRLTFAFRNTVGRSPDDRERPILEKLYQAQLSKYRRDPKATRALLTGSGHRPPHDVDSAELAAWTTLANVILNLDEAITRE